MPGGMFDSSKTRVVPVFEALAAGDADWVPQLLGLAQGRDAAEVDEPAGDLTFLKGHWGTNEKGISPPVSLLAWMIRHPEQLTTKTSTNPDRQRLLAGDPSAVELALDSLRRESADRAWYVFEGRTFPDAVIETPDALIVIEGKRTEAGPTTATTWLAGRHQVWRHIDAAWERKGRRKVYGMFIVEAKDSSDAVPSLWLEAVTDALEPEALRTSFPHRSAVEVESIQRCLLGVTTWQAVCTAFGLAREVLVEQL